MNRNDEFTLKDFMAQMDKVKNLGSMEKIMDQIPGMSRPRKRSTRSVVTKSRGRWHEMRAIYDSMAKRERQAR